MIDDIERRLRDAAPRGAPPELRARVLSAVSDELRSGRPRRDFRPGLAAAAAVVAGLGLNLWVSDRQERRMAGLLGPPPVRRRAAEIADDIAAIADPAAARWAYERVVDQLDRPDDSRRPADRLRRAIRQLTADMKGITDEAFQLQEDPQVDRDRRGSRDRDPADRQRDLRLAQRLTA